MSETAFYNLPDTLGGEVEQFDADIEGYKKGDIHPAQFKGIRVAHGIYEQRKLDTHMVRIRLPGGQITPTQLRKVAEISQRYGAPEFHVTTRTDVQLHYVDLEDIIPVYEGLISVGLAPRGGGGNTIRNIMASHDSGVAADEVFDVAPYASALTTRLISEQDSWNLPRKFKIAFSNSPEDNANATITCLGFIARIQDDQKGFRVYVGGGMGANPILGKVLYDWVPDARVYYIARGIKILFDRLGDRRRKYQSRFKFLVEKLGTDEIRRILEEEMAQLEPGLELDTTPFEIANVAHDSIGLEVEEASGKAFDQWKSRYVLAQKQEGLVEIKIPLHLGDILNDDGVALADFLASFGENCIRTSLVQNLHLRNIPTRYVGNVYNHLQTLHTLSTTPVVISNLVACTGADTCKLGICLPRGLTPAITKTLLESDLDLDALADVKIHISGCPNTCGRHHAADLGFFGKVLRKDGEMLPAYNIMAGAIVGDGETRFAEKVADIPAQDTPAFVRDLLAEYLGKKNNYQGFSEYMNNGGRADIKRLVDKYREIPEDDGYFYDWGTQNRFSLLKGQKAECCAGVFDMIDIDLKAAKQLAPQLDTLEGDALHDALYKTVFHCARMLLVTRAIEARTDAQAFDMFAQHFIEANLVDAKFRSIVEAAKAKDYEMLEMARERVTGLVETMETLYKSMDDSLKFNVDPVCETPVKEDNTPGFVEGDAPAEASGNGDTDQFKDYRGVACPINFVKTKLVLETMQTGQTLEILLDDGEPIENVPNSVKLEGHSILNQEKAPDGHWSVLIEKA
ncbi:MAG: sulfurtransferase TusA family protein [Verrucomicrobia bacterium]|nr:sulfurtransferase TusA family protein [Verrucomicrobiota bacterium]MDA1085444.1 sulfurtransferase TusA family protein [Verrucomicrobiota bacterium]